MTPEAESQGLPQGFNDELVASADEIVTRPRPQSEAFDISRSIAAERRAYDERHSAAVLADRRDPEADQARFVDPAAENAGEPLDEETLARWNDAYTVATLKDLLDENGVAYTSKASKPELIKIAAANFELAPAAETPPVGEPATVADAGTATFGGAGEAS